MKATKRILCLLLALCMVFSLTTAASAEETPEYSASAEEEAVANSGNFSEAVEEEGFPEEETVATEASDTVIADDHTVIIPVGSSATVSIPDSSYSSGTYSMDSAVASASMKEIEATTTPERASTVENGKKYYILWSSGNGVYLDYNADTTKSVSSAELWTAAANGSGFTFQNSKGKYLYYEFLYFGHEHSGTAKLSVNDTSFIFAVNGCVITAYYSYTDSEGVIVNSSYTAGYACDELTPASTEVTFTGLSAGTTTCTLTNVAGETVTYTVVVTQGKEITVEAGKDYAIGCESTDMVYTSELDTSIATVSDVDSSSASAATYTKVTELTAGKQYIIVNKNSGTVLTSESSTYKNYKGVITNGLKLTNAATINSDGTLTGTALEQYLWTYEENSNVSGYTVKTADGRYISFDYKNVTMVSSCDGTVGRVVSNGNSGEFNIIDNGTSTIYKLNDYGNEGITAAGFYSEATQPVNSWYFYEYTPGVSGKVTVHGITVGDTYVTVGTTRYTVHVVASSLTVNMYISTFGVWDINDSSKVTHITISSADEGVNSANGIALSTKVPAKGGWDSADSSVDTVYWKGVVLHDGMKQSASSDTDYSMKGMDYQYIRFYNGAWSVSEDQTTWTDIQSDDEVDAYYLQKTSVTSEVDTYVKDWAYLPGNTSSYSSATRDEKALSFAVVYPDGQMKTEEEIYASSTLLYWDNLNPLTFIRVGVNDQYEVSRITYTFGHRTCDGLTNTDDTAEDINGMTHTYWTRDDAITWNKKTTDNKEWYAETTCWDETYGTEPVVNGADLAEQIYAGEAQDTTNGTRYNGNWGDNDAVLILIYLKPVTTQDSLTVQYWDDSGDAEIYSYFVNINNESTSETGTFLNRLTDNGTVIGAQGPWTGATSDDAKYLPDTAYVENAAGVNKTFQKNLLRIPDLTGKYTSGLYTYAWAEVSSADSKTLILHYVLDDSKLTKSYVIDFGLPVDIPVADLKIANYSDISVQNGTYGTAAVTTDDEAVKYITYTPSTVVQGCDTVIVTYTFKETDASTGVEAVTTHDYTLLIYPATTVYYEEDFITGVPTTRTSRQTATMLGAALSTDPDAHYGFDSAYAEAGAGASDGTQLTSTTVGDTYSFEFTGTGIDLYGNLKTDDAYLVVQIVSNTTSKTSAYAVIDAKLAAGKYAATKNQGVDGYNVPIYSKDNLTRDTYTVTLSHVVGGTINLDGFRVYNTMVDSSIYVKDMEDNPVFVELRDLSLKVIDLGTVNKNAKSYGTVAQLGGQVYSEIETNEDGTLATDSDTTAYATLTYTNTDTGVTADDIQNDLILNGPKNEIYLYSDSELKIHVKSERTVQIGLKGVDQATSCTINGKTYNVSTVEMFYTVTVPNKDGDLVIKNSGNGLLSVTKLKVSDEITVYPVTEEDITDILTDAGFEDAVVTGDASLVLSIKTTSGKVLATTTLTAAGDEGTEVTFAKAGIKAALTSLADANGLRLNSRNSYKDVTVAVGSSTAVSYYGSAKK